MQLKNLAQKARDHDISGPYCYLYGVSYQSLGILAVEMPALS